MLGKSRNGQELLREKHLLVAKHIGHSLEWLFAILTFWLGFSLLGALAVYFQRERLEVVT